MSATHPETRLDSRRAIALVARRELQARLVSKAFVVSIAVTVALVFAIFGMGALLGNDDPVRIGIVGEAPAAAQDNLEQLAALRDTDIEISEIADRDAATAAIEAGDVDAAVIGGELLMEQTDDDIVALVMPAWQPASLITPLQVVELEPDPDADAKGTVAFASVILLFISIQIAGSYIMLGVFEEKSSKVVEPILSSVRARDLLAGKVIGVGVIGLAQVVALAGSVLIAASVFGSSALPVLSGWLVVSAVVWFLLGYVLYGAIFAAGASLAPRQEDAQSTMSPISVVLMLSYFAAIFSAASPESLASRIISWLPISAPFTMPGRMASGDAPAWEVAGSMALTAVAAAAVLLLAERIYVRSVIHTDRTLGWREAWAMRG